MFAKHPTAIISYIVYMLMFWRDIYMIKNLSEQMKLHPERSGLANGGEAVGTVVFGTFFVGIIFGVIIGGFAVGAKENKFYLWMLPLIIIPLIILGNI
jgi:hypothetical protein